MRPRRSQKRTYEGYDETEADALEENDDPHDPDVAEEAMEEEDEEADDEEFEEVVPPPRKRARTSGGGRRRSTTKKEESAVLVEEATAVAAPEPPAELTPEEAERRYKEGTANLALKIVLRRIGDFLDDVADVERLSTVSHTFRQLLVRDPSAWKQWVGPLRKAKKLKQKEAIKKFPISAAQVNKLPHTMYTKRERGTRYEKTVYQFNQADVFMRCITKTGRKGKTDISLAHLFRGLELRRRRQEAKERRDRRAAFLSEHVRDWQMMLDKCVQSKTQLLTAFPLLESTMRARFNRMRAAIEDAEAKAAEDDFDASAVHAAIPGLKAIYSLLSTAKLLSEVRKLARRTVALLRPDGDAEVAARCEEARAQCAALESADDPERLKLIHATVQNALTEVSGAAKERKAAMRQEVKRRVDRLISDTRSKDLMLSSDARRTQLRAKLAAHGCETNPARSPLLKAYHSWTFDERGPMCWFEVVGARVYTERLVRSGALSQIVQNARGSLESRAVEQICSEWVTKKENGVQDCEPDITLDTIEAAYVQAGEDMGAAGVSAHMSERRDYYYDGYDSDYGGYRGYGGYGRYGRYGWG